MNWTEFGFLEFHLDFPGGSLVKSPTRAGDDNSILGKEAPLEKEMATDFIILAWEITCPKEPGRLYSPWVCPGGLYSPWACEKLDTT